MQKTKVYALLDSLSDTESVRFADFLAADYFNSSVLVRQLYEHLRKYKTKTQAEDDGLLQLEWPSKPDLFATLFPGETYNAKRLTYLLSELNQLGESFLGVERLLASEQELQLQTLEELSVRRLSKSYRYVDARISHQLSRRESNSAKRLWHQLRWLDIRENHFSRSRHRSFDLTIQQASDTLDRYYFLRRLTFACAMLDRQTIFKENYALRLTDGWLQHLLEADFFEEPLIQLYYSIFQALQEEANEEHFKRLKGKLEELEDTIAEEDLKDIYLFTINYCARKIRQGQALYTIEALRLYRRGISKALLLEDGKLSPWAFTNVVKLSLRLKEFNAAENFIAEYGPLLPESFRENAMHYNLAELCYYTEDFERAQSELLLVAYSDLNYYLGARVLLAKIYWAMQAEEALFSLIASFTIFLKRNQQLSNDLKHTYLNFCQLLYKSVRAGAKRTEALAQEIQETKLLTDRAWLLEVLQEQSEKF